MTPIRVVTYNVRYFSQALGGLAPTRGTLERNARAIASLRPHIVCLQEVEARSLRSSLASRRRTQHAAFADALAASDGPRYDALYFAAHVAGHPARPLYTTGLSVLVDETFMVDATETIDLGGAGERRVCAYLALRRRDDLMPLHVFNAHLSLPRPLHARLGDADNQIEQASLLVQAVRARSGKDAFVLCGDLNSIPGSAAIAHILERTTAFPAPCGDGATAGFGPFRRRLDHLFAGNGVRWLDGDGTHAFGDRRCAFAGLSDHAPLVARFVAQ